MTKCWGEPCQELVSNQSGSSVDGTETQYKLWPCGSPEVRPYIYLTAPPESIRADLDGTVLMTS